jgi:hypothetical protein
MFTSILRAQRASMHKKSADGFGGSMSLRDRVDDGRRPADRITGCEDPVP